MGSNFKLRSSGSWTDRIWDCDSVLNQISPTADDTAILDSKSSSRVLVVDAETVCDTLVASGVTASVLVLNAPLQLNILSAVAGLMITGPADLIVAACDCTGVDWSGFTGKLRFTNETGSSSWLDNFPGEVVIDDAVVSVGSISSKITLLNIASGTWRCPASCTFGSIRSSGSNRRAIDLIDGTVVLAGTGNVWDIDFKTAVVAYNSEIIIQDTSGMEKRFIGGAAHYHKLTARPGSGVIKLDSPMSFDHLAIAAPLDLNGETIEVGSLDLTGCPSVSNGVISCKSGKIIAPPGCLIDNCKAIGGAYFDASEAFQVTPSEGWTFDTSRPTKTGMFMAF